MTGPGRIEIDILPIVSHPVIAPMLSDNLTKGLFNGDRLALLQPPGWYVPEWVIHEPITHSGATSSLVIMGDRFYSFAAKAEAYRSGEVKTILDTLSQSIATPAIRDYCYLGGGGLIEVDEDGFQYKNRAGRLTVNPPQNPGKGSDGRIIYFEPMELQFEEV